MGTNLLHRKTKTEKVTQQAWDYLKHTVESAGDTARTAKRHGGYLADSTKSTLSTAGGTLHSATDEAKYRATAALDALAGRRPGLPWTWIVGASVLGVAIGWAAGVAVRKAVAERTAEEELDEADEVVAIYTGEKTPVGRLDS